GAGVCAPAPVNPSRGAPPRARAGRRASGLSGGAPPAEIERMAREIAERDARDRGRAHSPLRPADDALQLDTTRQTVDEVVATLCALVRSRTSTLASHS